MSPLNPQRAALAVVKLLWVDYGVAFSPGEEPIFVLKLLVLFDLVEEQKRRSLERYYERSLN